MRAWFQLRMLAWAKRGVLALESIAKSQAALAEAAEVPARRLKNPKMTSVFTASIEDQNRAWQAHRDAEVYGEEIDDGWQEGR